MIIRIELIKGICFKAALVVANVIVVATSALAEPLSVGVIVPLSGGLSEYGVAVRNGIELALTDQPSSKEKIRFIFEDSQHDNKLALSAFEKLVTSDKCQLIFIWGSGPSEAVAPVAEKKAFPLITWGEHNAALGRSHVINFGNPSFQFSKALIQHLRGRGYKKLTMVMTQITFFESLMRSFREELVSTENLTIAGAYSPSESDFKTAIAKIKSDKPDALGIFLLNGQVSLFYRQLEALNLSLPTFGTDVFESTSEIAASEPTIEGAVYPHNVVSDEFRNRYVSKYKTDAHLTTAGRGYDLAILTAQNVSTSGSDLFNRLTQLSPQDGVSGRFEFLDTPDYGKRFEFPIVIKKIVHGKPVVVSE